MTKRIVVSRKKMQMEVEEGILKFFPPTSRMGIEISTPWGWGQGPGLNRKDDKPPRRRLRKVAMSSPL